MKEFAADHRRVGSAGTNRTGRSRARVVLALAVLALGAAGVAVAAMHSTKLGPLLCETTGGGRFVKIPGFPGEKIDRRLLDDVDYLQERFKIFVTDGYSLDPVHSHNGEHPIGLALDIVPDFATRRQLAEDHQARQLGRAQAEPAACTVPLGRLQRRRRARPRPPPAPLLQPLPHQVQRPGADDAEHQVPGLGRRRPEGPEGRRRRTAAAHRAASASPATT